MGTQLTMPEVALDLEDEDLPPTTRSAPPVGKPRGFAAMDRARVSEIARKGGIAAHAKGTAHKWTREEATAAGKKGGTAPHVRRGRARA